MITSEMKLKKLEKAIKEIIVYPPKKSNRRTKDGYPLELLYDEFAYKRIVNSYRDGLKNLLKQFFTSER